MRFGPCKKDKMNMKNIYKRKLKKFKVIKYVLSNPALQLNFELILANHLRPKLNKLTHFVFTLIQLHLIIVY